MKVFYPLIVFVSVMFSALLNAEIVSEHEAKIHTLVSDLFDVEKAERIETIGGGFSSQGLYKVTVKGMPHIVRFANSERTVADRQRELQAMRIVGELGCAPRVLVADAVEGVVLMTFIEDQRDKGDFDLLSATCLERLGRALRKVHEGPAFGKVDWMHTAEDFIDKVLSAARPSLIEQARAQMKRLHETLRDQLIEKPCHNDLNPNNILQAADAVYFVDWEAAGQSDPYFDLATPAVLYGMSAEQEELYLKAYFSRSPLPGERSKYASMKQFVGLHYGLLLVGVSRLMGADLMSEDEIAAAPRLEAVLMRDMRVCTPREVQEAGYAYLREAI